MTTERLRGLQGVQSDGQPPELQRRKLEGLARTFEPDERNEQMLALKESDPAAYERLPRLVRWSLAHYSNARKAAIEVGSYTPGGTA